MGKTNQKASSHKIVTAKQVQHYCGDVADLSEIYKEIRQLVWGEILCLVLQPLQTQMT